MNTTQQLKAILRYHRHLIQNGEFLTVDEAARRWISQFADLWRWHEHRRFLQKPKIDREGIHPLVMIKGAPVIVGMVGSILRAVADMGYDVQMTFAGIDTINLIATDQMTGEVFIVRASTPRRAAIELAGLVELDLGNSFSR